MRPPERLQGSGDIRERVQLQHEPRATVHFAEPGRVVRIQRYPEAVRLRFAMLGHVSIVGLPLSEYPCPCCCEENEEEEEPTPLLRRRAIHALDPVLALRYRRDETRYAA